MLGFQMRGFKFWFQTRAVVSDLDFDARVRVLKLVFEVQLGSQASDKDDKEIGVLG